MKGGWTWPTALQVDAVQDIRLEQERFKKWTREENDDDQTCFRGEGQWMPHTILMNDVATERRLQQRRSSNEHDNKRIIALSGAAMKERRTPLRTLLNEAAEDNQLLPPWVMEKS